jgi:uncharacterized membrane protein YkvA (DUF1232 family)
MAVSDAESGRLMLTKLKHWAKTIKRDVVALYLAARDSRTPWYAKVTAAAVAAYALSPIDLIPDFIPVLGYLDDLAKMADVSAFAFPGVWMAAGDGLDDGDVCCKYRYFGRL